ncbi:MAG: toxin-antitoxin system protein [Clostridiales bacterium]|nr:toxin-antitoxin system protein [Clostridiales bacterium]
MKPLKKRVSLTLDEETIEESKILADQYDRSLSQYINLVLKDHLGKQSSQSSADVGNTK